MTFCLDSTIIKPEKDKDINNVIVLLHGYGGDGKDISMVALNWKRYIPNTIFLFVLTAIKIVQLIHLAFNGSI